MCAAGQHHEAASGKIGSKPLYLELGARFLLQTSRVRLKKPTFTPLGPDEEPGAGTLLAIDTEFVAHSPPDKVFKG